MGLSAAEIKALNHIESEMARKGFALGDTLDTQITALEANTAYDSQAAAADPGDAGSLSASSKLDEIVSAGAETRVLPAPAAGYTGIKVIRFKTDGGDVTIDAGNVLGYTTEDYTLDTAGDTIVLIANGGAKWVQIGGSKTPA